MSGLGEKPGEGRAASDLKTPEPVAGLQVRRELLPLRASKGALERGRAQAGFFQKLAGNEALAAGIALDEAPNCVSLPIAVKEDRYRPGNYQPASVGR